MQGSTRRTREAPTDSAQAHSATLSPLGAVPGRAAPWPHSAEPFPCSHQAGPFPRSLADLHFIWEVSRSGSSLPGGTQGFPCGWWGCELQRQPWAWLCGTAAALGQTRGAAVPGAARPWHRPWDCSLCIHTLHPHPAFLTFITPAAHSHPWAAALNSKAICFFYFFTKGSATLVLPRVPSYSITDSSLPCELPLYVYATSKFQKLCIWCWCSFLWIEVRWDFPAPALLAEAGKWQVWILSLPDTLPIGQALLNIPAYTGKYKVSWWDTRKSEHQIY